MLVLKAMQKMIAYLCANGGFLVINSENLRHLKLVNWTCASKDFTPKLLIGVQEHLGQRDLWYLVEILGPRMIRLI